MKFLFSSGWLWLALLVYLVSRFPPLVHQPGGTDEGFFAVPGMTLWYEGVPRIPFFHTQLRSSFFANADRCVMTLPPGLHLIQAPFFGLLPPSLFTARLPVFLLGLVMIILVAQLASQIGIPRWQVAAATCLFALCRPLMFCALISRPDLPCALCGLFAIYSMTRWQQGGRWAWLCVAGFSSGLGVVFHPFGIIAFAQVSCWSLLRSGAWKIRFMRWAVAGACSFFSSCIWLYFIVRYPIEFQDQFISNVVEQSGPGMGSRMVWPIPSLQHHWILLWKLNEPTQFIWMLIGLLCSLVIVIRKDTSKEFKQRFLVAVTAGYLTAIVVGLHYTKGYWLYPTALAIPFIVHGWAGLFSAVAKLLSKGVRVDSSRAASTVGRISPGNSAIVLATCILGIIAMIPQGGFRSSYVYWTHWGDPQYHARNFIRSVLSEIPTGASVCSDEAYLFEIYLTGRETILCTHAKDYDPDHLPKFDYLFLSILGNSYHWENEHRARFLMQKGSKETPHHCYVDVFAPLEERELLTSP